MAVTVGRAVDVRVSWGDSVLFAAELSPPRPCFVGADDVWDDAERCSVALPAEAIGARRAALVDVDRRGGVDVLAPPGASVELSSLQRSSRGRDELVADGTARRCDAIPGAHRVALRSGERLRIVCGDFVFDVARGARSPATSRRPRLDARSSAWALASAAAHLGMLAACASVVPSLASTDDDVVIVADAALTEPAFVPVTALPEVAIPDAEAIGARARRGQDLGVEQAGALGLGEPRAPAVSNRYGVRGPRDNPDPHLGRREVGGDDVVVPFIEPPDHFEPAPGSRGRSPLAPWGRDDSLGNDAESARGEMWGDEIGESFGAGGLGLAGESECGCGSIRALAPGEVRDFVALVRPRDAPSHEPAAVIVGRPAAGHRYR